MNRNIVIISSVVIASLVGIGVFTFEYMFQEASQKEVNLIMNVWPGYAHAIIADERGFFEDNGVQVNLKVVKEYPDMINLFLDGGYDGFFGVYSDVILLNSKGTPLKVVYIADYSSGGDVVVSEPDIATVADLKGKTIGIEELNSFSHVFLLDLLKRNGLTESDVTMVEIPAHQVLDALDSGIIDAGHTWEPTQSEALAKGYKLLATSADTPGIITDVLAFKKSVVEERSEDVRKVVASLEKARIFVETDRNAAFAIMSERLEVSPGELKDGLEGVNQLDLEGNKAAFTPSKEIISLYGSGEFISSIFEKNGIITEPVDIEEILAPEIVDGIK
ncbi:MAG: ABC transporter substrate-binding protein [Thaumarchaeota archaeon]|nr:ABC transporter substrate-binding protein [Nitrososphaerota archaeon]